MPEPLLQVSAAVSGSPAPLPLTRPGASSGRPHPLAWAGLFSVFLGTAGQEPRAPSARVPGWGTCALTGMRVPGRALCVQSTTSLFTRGYQQPGGPSCPGCLGLAMSPRHTMLTGDICLGSNKDLGPPRLGDPGPETCLNPPPGAQSPQFCHWQEA